ncbi:multidrug efflux SMR transporter [Roseibium hamelinense]|nr:multidrug efflux SMR transporter [Roseibium hamelinense]MTI46003.1 multidrug efflux SMR transporter [Roseibium hamelinense]
MAWIFLLAAGILEVAWATAMKESHGFSRLVPTVVMLVTMAGSFGLLAVSMRSLPLGTAYPVWVGIGAIGAFCVGALVFGEVLTPLRVAAALMILGGVVLMKLA